MVHGENENRKGPPAHQPQPTCSLMDKNKPDSGAHGHCALREDGEMNGQSCAPTLSDSKVMWESHTE